MPRALKLVIGLTEIDPRAPYYQSYLPGFDGRNGCEGVTADLRRMEELTHYLGFQSIVGAPLRNEHATFGAVCRALEATVEEMARSNEPDILVLYFSGHGRVLGPAVGGNEHDLNSSLPSRPDVLDESYVNHFLLWDRPIFNFEILSRLAPLKSQHRVVTIFDACHAGLGTQRFGYQEAQAVLELEKYPVMSKALHSESLDESFRRSLLLNLVLQRRAPIDLSVLSPLEIEVTTMILINLQQLGALKDGDPRRRIPRLDCDLAHFGAARSLLTAVGNTNGSRFTQLFQMAFAQRGQTSTYQAFHKILRDASPRVHEPLFVPYPLDNGTFRPAPTHFATQQHVLQIIP